MADLPDAAVQAAAEVMFRQYNTEYDAGHLTWRDFADDAREILGAAWPHLPGFRPEPVSLATVRSVACPSCGAGPGELCRVMKSRVTHASYPMSTVHFNRRRLAASNHLEMPGA